MNRHSSLVLTALLLLMGLTASGWAQGNVAEAQRLAGILGNQSEFPVNVRLRYQVLNGRLPSLKGKEDPQPILTFFSTTRILTWNRPVGTQTAETVKRFEAEMVALAKEKGFALDLPPVGYSTTVSGAARPTSGQGSFLPRAVDRPTLAKAVLTAEEFGTDALARTSTPQLLALRDSLTALRVDLADRGVASDTVREVLRTRVEFLASPAAASADAGLLQSLDNAADLLRANFPPEVLRQSRGLTIEF